MAITASDIQFRLMVKTGSAGNSTAGTPAGSLGGYPSTTQMTDATLHNLFDVVSGDENAASDVEYRGLGVYNAHGSLTAENGKGWISSETAGGATAAIGVDPSAAKTISSATKHTEVADESTAPGSVSFSSPTVKASGIDLGNVSAGFVKQVWVRRTAANTAALDLDGFVLRVEFDTAA